MTWLFWVITLSLFVFFSGIGGFLGYELSRYHHSKKKTRIYTTLGVLFGAVLASIFGLGLYWIMKSEYYDETVITTTPSPLELELELEQEQELDQGHDQEPETESPITTFQPSDKDYVLLNRLSRYV